MLSKKLCMKKEKIKKLLSKDSIIQIVKFGIVGASNTIVFYVIYVAALRFLEFFRIFPERNYIFANILGWFVSVFWSFIWNRNFVFCAEENLSWWSVLFKAYISYAFTGIVLNNILSYFWIEMVGLEKIIAPIINLVITVPLNFIMNKFWAFR